MRINSSAPSALTVLESLTNWDSWNICTSFSRTNFVPQETSVKREDQLILRLAILGMGDLVGEKLGFCVGDRVGYCEGTQLATEIGAKGDDVGIN